ncbi:peptidoglycan hydrolase CwlO-like protein [Bacillus oleivorans]|uniref:Peptidoglycan hydrolase CwlO-like protein n=1 Tax=Bacillus oleivorans TaxID=1448271 RepID=A0A285CZ38_9BACI|nr:peptidoglycan DD-metalloendopeptidase family protein [Bacillus oleivorans]SNX72811.1 peptidoglycan hydrolase CwlO-like protein [Bacillus oleivorans]
MKKSTLSIVTAFFLLVGTLTYSVAEANTLSDLEDQKDSISEERSGVNSEIDKKNAEISSLQAEQDRIKQEVQALDTKISETNTKINEKDQEIARKKEEISLLQAEIRELTETIEKRNELLKERARSFQRSGGALSYLDVLLGANSFGEFISRVNAVSTIMDADKQLIKQQEEDLAKLEKLQKQQEEELAKLETLRKELEEMKASLDSQRKEKDALMEELRQQQINIENEVMDLKEQEELLAAQEAAMAKAIKLEKERLAELERQRKAAQANGGSYPADTGGSFMIPSAGYVSSEFGPRWGDFHYGIDIAKGGHVPVLAAADGVVIRSYYSPSYGNAIFVSHSINGQIFTTVYAHLNSRSVGEGEVVARGQQIGVMGNTGMSFGQHLHFEIHEGPWNANKSNAVDPRKYLSF